MARPKPLADLLNVCLGPSLAAQGFAAADIITAWPEIVGARLADRSQPVRIERKRRGRGADEGRPEPATLVVRVESAFAIDMQHLAPIVIERVNAHYGWRCIGRLVLKQGPVGRAGPRRPTTPSLSAADRTRVAAACDGIAEDRLRAALDRLGQAVISESQKDAERTKA